MKELFNNMNIVSRYTIKYGTVLLITLAATAFYFYLRAETSSDPYIYISLYTDILFSLKEYIAVIYILPLFAEIIILAAKEQFN